MSEFSTVSVPLFRRGQSNLNGIIYEKDSIKKAFEEFLKRPQLIYKNFRNDEEEPPVEDIVGTIVGFDSEKGTIDVSLNAQGYAFFKEGMFSAGRFIGFLEEDLVNARIDSVERMFLVEEKELKGTFEE